LSLRECFEPAASAEGLPDCQINVVADEFDSAIGEECMRSSRMPTPRRDMSLEIPGEASIVIDAIQQPGIWRAGRIIEHLSQRADIIKSRDSLGNSTVPTGVDTEQFLDVGGHQ